MPKARATRVQTAAQWRFQECGNHFHAELEVDGAVFPGGSLTKGCCWPTAHALKRSPFGYTASPTAAELAVLQALSDCMPPSALGHALGLSAAYHQHRISGVRYEPLASDLLLDNPPIDDLSFPSIGVVADSARNVCPLLLLGIRGDVVDAVPLISWSREEGLDLAAGRSCICVPALAVVPDPQLALQICYLWRKDITASEERREKITSLLAVLYPHHPVDPDVDPIYLAALLHEHLASDGSGKFDKQCREILDSLAPDGEEYSITQTGNYLAIVRELQRWCHPLEVAIKTGNYDGLAQDMDMPLFAPRLAMMLSDLQVLQMGRQPYLHRELSEADRTFAELLFRAPDDDGTPVLEMMAPILHRLFSRTITHTITNPAGALFQAIDEFLDRDPRPSASEARH